MELDGSTIGPFAGGGVIATAIYLLVKGLIDKWKGKPEEDRKRNRDRREEIVEILEREEKAWATATDQASKARKWHAHASRLEGQLLRAGIEPHKWPDTEDRKNV